MGVSSMPRLTTFGCEAEFEQNAAGVLTRLHERELAAEGSLHSYHCDCDACSFNNGWAFRGQTDSSCSGEIITDIFGGDEDDGFVDYDHVNLFSELSAAAIDVDAEPGLRSAFHVHVGVNALSYDEKIRIFYQILRWEPVLMQIAGARWIHQRAGMNNTITETVSERFEDMTGQTLGPKSLRAFKPDYDVMSALLQYQAEADRHSNLNVSVRRCPTWEFRLWNSTRSAWRMELFAGLSVALVDPDVTDNLSQVDTPKSAKPTASIAPIIGAVDQAGHCRVAELLERQSTYLTKRAVSAPANFTIL